MEENKTIPLTQKDYQKKYDKKTKTISVKYALHEMDDYDRMIKYLDKTGKSVNGFIKELINDFFEKEKYVMNRKKCAEYFVDYNISQDLQDKLKETVGNDRYKIIMDCYVDSIDDELDSAYNEKGDALDRWTEQFLIDVESGEIKINVSNDEFKKIISDSISENMGEIMYYD